LSAPLAKPKGGKPSPCGAALSDDFSSGKQGLQWGFFDPSEDDGTRIRHEDRSLVIKGKGTSLADCSPLTCVVGDRRYEAQVRLDIVGEAQGGLALFYDQRAFVGVGLGGGQLLTYNYGQEHSWMREPAKGRGVTFKVTNIDNVVTFHYSYDGTRFVQHPWQMEVSGFHHNVFGGFLSLRLAIFSAGRGEIRVRDFRYRGLEG
jgi:xylan 1,4-beta-xylosidase